MRFPKIKNKIGLFRLVDYWIRYRVLKENLNQTSIQQKIKSKHVYLMLIKFLKVNLVGFFFLKKNIVLCAIIL
jgi:hypothetical protein